MKEPTTQANFRFPESLMRRLKADAEASDRSMTAQARFILDRELPPEPETKED